jgi:SAM-dependent methyltransferase
MQHESFKPIPVKAPSSSRMMYALRRLLDLQFHTIVEFLRPAMGTLKGKVLDVGAGQSPWKEWLSTDASYVGLDVENAGEFGMSQAREGITYYDGRSIPFADSSFDAVICIEVLEHAEDPDILVAEISRCLRRGGTLLLSVPWSARRHHIPHDYHRFTRERLERLLISHGFGGVQISERGTDIATIANKLVVLSIRLAPLRVALRSLLALPLFLLVAPIAAGFVVCANLSGWLGWGAKEDPLGYFVQAVRD